MANIIVNVLLKYCNMNAHVLLDIVLIYNKLKEYEKAIKFLNDKFEFLLHNQPAKELLKYYQLIEANLPLSMDKSQIMMNKAILLEICEEYDQCLFYIDILKNNIIDKTDGWQKIFYLEMRCFYFLNKYDDLLGAVKKYAAKLKQFSNFIFIQIFLLVGRVYYIRGFFNEATFFYLIAYYEALKNNDIILITKSIHRIAMVEMKKGLITESYNTFRILANLNETITVKRKSYIYYRLAECEYKIEHYDEAIKYNEISYQLKQSIDHKRGLIYCHRLSAKIALKLENYIKANCEIQIALDISRKMDLHKEEISCTVVQLKILKKMHMDFPNTMYDILNQHLLIAQSEKNVYRLQQIGNSIKDINEEKYIESNHISNIISVC